jgi:hypothetical protein
MIGLRSKIGDLACGLVVVRAMVAMVALEYILGHRYRYNSLPQLPIQLFRYRWSCRSLGQA